jgi:hypothetical protein
MEVVIVASHSAPEIGLAGEMNNPRAEGSALLTLICCQMSLAFLTAMTLTLLSPAETPRFVTEAPVEGEV